MVVKAGAHDKPKILQSRIDVGSKRWRLRDSKVLRAFVYGYRIGTLYGTWSHANDYRTRFLLYFGASLSIPFNGHFYRWSWVRRYQNVSIVECIQTKDDGGGGDNWSCKTWKASVKIITTFNIPTSHLFTGQMLCLSPNQQCQSTKGPLGVHRTFLLALVKNKKFEADFDDYNYSQCFI